MNQAASLIIKLKVPHDVEAAFAAWHARAATAPATFAGFLSAEIDAPSAPDDTEWTVTQHFRSREAMRAWAESQEHARLMAEIRASVSELTQLESVEGKADAPVTEVIATIVKPGQEERYRQWATRIHAAEARFQGYRGGYLQPPASSKQPYWTTLVRFATPEQLDTWLGSAARQQLLQEQEALVESWRSQRLPSSFAGWFPADEPDREPSTTLKQSMVVLLMLFPVVMIELRFLNPLLKSTPAAMATFIGNAISVALLGWPLMPLVTSFSRWWLTPRRGTGLALRFAGYGLFIMFYAIKIVALWKLL